MEDFVEYLQMTYGVASGTANSHKIAIKILDNIFDQYDVLNFAGKPIVSITDVCEIPAIKISDYNAA